MISRRNFIAAMPRSRIAWTRSLALAAVVFFAGLPVQSPRAVIRNPEDLLIVDCLLPGQVRKLGGMSQFMTARRPVRTTQADCEIRGGEFVSYDRANYETALKVWRGKADEGDAEAQNYVGEIYAKGLGIEPDFAKAAQWFEKSSAQGNKRAKINLGYLYEEGQGVPKDLSKALNLYRDATGAKGDDLVFASTVTVGAEAQAKIEELTKTVEQQKQEAGELRAKIAQLQGQLDSQRKKLDSSRSELDQARKKAVEKQASLVSPEQAAELGKLRDQLAAQEKQLAADRAALERDKTAAAADARAKSDELAKLKAQEAELNKRLSAGSSGTADIAAVKKDIDRVRAAATEMALALDDAYGKMGALEVKLGDNDKRLAEQQANFDAERQKMQAQLAASKQDRELLVLLEQQLAEKQRTVEGQRQQIAQLEGQITGGGPLGGGGSRSIAALGPVVELLEPPLTVTRGKPSAMVRSGQANSEVLAKVVAGAGIQSVQVNGQTVQVGANGMFKVSLPVGKDGTSVQIAAADKSGKLAQLDFTLVPVPASSRDGGVATAADKSAPKGVSLGRYHALVIGNDNYAAYPKLSSAVRDAQSVADVLKRRYGFDTRVLTNASKLDTLTALNELRESLKDDDNLLIYFAGHGELDAAKEGYWLPVDAQANAPNSWISNRAVSDILNMMSAKHVLVVADSCYSGSMTRASVPAASSALSAKLWNDYVKQMSGSRSRTALTSGGLQPVPDASGSGSSLFAKALVGTLTDNNQVLEAQRLYRTIATSLALSALESNFAQEPQYAPIKFAGHEAGEFFFVPGAGVAAVKSGG